MALVWLYFYQVPLALLPFTVYSVFHVATYTRNNLIPTIYPSPAPTGTSPGKAASRSSPFADQVGRFVKRYYEPSMSLVAALELALWFRLLFSTFTFARGTLILLGIYTVFVRSRYSQSTFVQNTIHEATRQVDALIANQSTPDAVKRVWITIKGLAAQATEATDLRKYVGAQAAPKKAQ